MAIEIPIPNIEQMLGILSMHQKTIRIRYKDNMLYVESGRKSTKVHASPDAKAFGHSLDSLKEFAEKSWSLKGKNRHREQSLQSG
jgi:hypothetical protein